VPVEVGGRFDAGVTALIANVLQNLPILDQQAPELVTEVVKSSPSQPCLFQALVRRLFFDVVHVDRIALAVAEDPPRDLVPAGGEVVLPSLPSKSRQLRQERVRQRLFLAFVGWIVPRTILRRTVRYLPFKATSPH
jgi:hypothetical protein